MIQVDIFWSYAFGAMFAVAAARQLKGDEKPFQSKYFTNLILYLSILFAPSGIYLLWKFTHWETMHVFPDPASLPAWLVVIFAVTNITQGILGFWIAYRFIRKGRFYAAHLQWWLGYFCMFFILVHGWDGTGWQRFLYDPTMHGGVLWSPGVHDGLAFATSNVAITLYVMGIFLIPPLFYILPKWIKEGAEMDTALPKEKVPKGTKDVLLMVLFVLLGVFGAGFGSAVIASLLVMFFTDLAGSLLIGFLTGIPIFAVLVYFLGIRRPMPIYLLAKQLFLAEPEAKTP